MCGLGILGINTGEGVLLEVIDVGERVQLACVIHKPKHVNVVCQTVTNFCVATGIERG